MDLVATCVKSEEVPPFKKKRFRWAEIMTALMHCPRQSKCQRANKQIAAARFSRHLS